MNTKCSCRSCNTPEIPVFLDLGLQPLANNLLGPEDSFDLEPRFPLEVAVCPECWLVQITETVPPVELFEDYIYFSSFSDAMLKHAKDAVSSYIEKFALSASSFAVEIASNDGYLLKNFVSAGIPCLGVEPAKNIATVAESAGIPTKCAFFGEESASEIVATQGKADLILGNNVFAHAPFINDFISGLATLLKEDGRIALEFPYLGDFIENLEFDTIYHEHVFYFSVSALQPAFARHGLEVFDVEHLTIHGGSLRLFVGHVGAHPSTERLVEVVRKEEAVGLLTFERYQKFADDVSKLKEIFRETVSNLKGEGKSIAAYGASAKGSTLLNYFGIGGETIDFVADRSNYKHDRLTPGMHLPIVAPGKLLDDMPDYAILLTWNFADEILSQQREYREAGGKFLIPLPSPRVV